MRFVLLLKRAGFDKSLARRDAEWHVDGENGDGRACGRRESKQNRAVIAEVFVPQIAPGMEELNYDAGFGIDAGQVRPLMLIASEAAEGKVIEFALAAVLAGDDVVEGMTEYGGESGNRQYSQRLSASRRIFWSSDSGIGGSGGGGFSAERGAGLGLQDHQHIVGGKQIVEFRFLVGRQLAELGLLREFLGASMVLGSETKRKKLLGEFGREFPFERLQDAIKSG